jgi:putative RNA 2'-phosphotransferase
LHDIEWQRSSSINRIVDAWPNLPPHIRETILTLVDSIPSRQFHFRHEEQPSVQSTSSNDFHMEGASKDFLRRSLLKALRHCPEQYNLNMDSDGWVNTVELGQLFRHLTGTNVPDFDQLLQVFLELDLIDRIQTKSGFVRAAYGHSTYRFAPSNTAIPDQPLFHGTSASNWSMIECFGLSPVKRRFVQLTTDFDYVSQIANLHGRSPIVLQVATAHAIECDVKFYPTGTHVWQATAVPAICLQIWLDNT